MVRKSLGFIWDRMTDTFTPLRSTYARGRKLKWPRLKEALLEGLISISRMILGLKEIESLMCSWMLGCRTTWFPWSLMQMVKVKCRGKRCSVSEILFLVVFSKSYQLSLQKLGTISIWRSGWPHLWRIQCWINWECSWQRKTCSKKWSPCFKESASFTRIWWNII